MQCGLDWPSKAVGSMWLYEKSYAEPHEFIQDSAKATVPVLRLVDQTFWTKVLMSCIGINTALSSKIAQVL